VKLQEG
jgi:hypothetical protein